MRWRGGGTGALITVIATAGSVRSAVARGYPGLAVAQHAVNVSLVIDYVGASIGVGVWLLLTWALVRGRGCARIALATDFEFGPVRRRRRCARLAGQAQACQRGDGHGE